jgi:hypothetical protein
LTRGKRSFAIADVRYGPAPGGSSRNSIRPPQLAASNDFNAAPFVVLKAVLMSHSLHNRKAPSGGSAGAFDLKYGTHTEQ